MQPSKEVFTYILCGYDSPGSLFSSRDEGWWMCTLSIYVSYRKVCIYDIFVCVKWSL